MSQEVGSLFVYANTGGPMETSVERNPLKRQKTSTQGGLICRVAAKNGKPQNIKS